MDYYIHEVKFPPSRVTSLLGKAILLKENKRFTFSCTVVRSNLVPYPVIESNKKRKMCEDRIADAVSDSVPIDAILLTQHWNELHPILRERLCAVVEAWNKDMKLI